MLYDILHSSTDFGYILKVFTIKNNTVDLLIVYENMHLILLRIEKM